MRRNQLSLCTLSVVVWLAALGCGGGEAPRRSIDATRSDVRAAVGASHTLALGLLDALHTTDGNLFYSPLSVEVALGMLYAGAAGETASQLKAALGAPEDAAEFHHGLGAVLGDLRGASGHGYTLDIANRVFPQTNVRLQPGFKATLAGPYAAPEQPLDFAGDVEAARITIDRWVEQQTQGQISELFRPGDLEPQTVLAVVSALYFKADWTHAFTASATKAAPFQRADGSSVDVQMMSLPEQELPLGAIEHARVVALPYRDSMLSFVALLPDAPDGAPALEHALSTMDLRALRAQLSPSKALVKLPRFTLHERLDLIPVLQELGVTDLFDGSKSDLSGIDGQSGLFVHPLLHEARISVDEAGTVAAAATGAGVLRSGPSQLFFEHPFVFFIYDDLTGAVLFTGRVADPSAPSTAVP